MSYSINQALTYTAEATTFEQPDDTFTYSWVFDDGGTANTASLSYTWTTSGNHLATVTVIDNQTGRSATAQKTVSVADWSALTWIYTANSMLPTGSGIASTAGLPLYTAEEYFVYVGEYYHPEVLVVMNTITNTVAQYTNATVGPMSCCYFLTTGSNAGKLLVVGVSSGKYAFVDLATGVFTIGTATLPFTSPTRFGNQRTMLVMMGNGKIYMPAYGYDGYNYKNQCMTYDPINDIWANAATWSGTPLLNGSYLEAYPLPSGKVFLVRQTSPCAYIVDGITQTVTAGPTSTSLLSSNSVALNCIAQLPNKTLVGMKFGASASVMGTFTEGDDDWVWGSTPSPTINNYYNNLVVTSDGIVASIGRGQQDTPHTTIFYNPLNDSWVQSAVLPYDNICAYLGFAGGRFWRCTRQGNLYYMVWP